MPNCAARSVAWVDVRTDRAGDRQTVNGPQQARESREGERRRRSTEREVEGERE
jgi:hypothetical protein